MAARFSHASATPSVLDLNIRSMSTDENVPTQEHTTDYGVRLRYVLGVRFRTASIELYVKTATEHDQFWTFYRTVTNANTRFTFIADTTNFGSDTWSAFFTSTPSFDRDKRVGGARNAGTIKVDIADAPVTL
jgi:hypothetical protein